MKIKPPINVNYCATVVTLNKFIQLDNCDNVKHTFILNSLVIVGNDLNIGAKGLFFPVETQLSQGFLYANNLYRDSQLNKDKSVKGYFEQTGRIKCMKFRGHKSEGLFLPLSCLFDFATVEELSSLKNGDEFDEINGILICKKYVIQTNNTISNKNDRSVSNKKGIKKVSKLIENQFRYHVNTINLRKNSHILSYEDFVTITYKLHGTSFVISNLLTRKKLPWFYKLLKSFKIKVIDTEYSNLYSSRKVIKNAFENQVNKDYYENSDLWKLINDEIYPILPKGFSVYGECVGFLPDGRYIQKDYDYGCSPKEHRNYIYRITYTNVNGDVFELSFAQVKEFCNRYGLLHVPELYSGTVGKQYFIPLHNFNQEEYVRRLESEYLEKDCKMCNNKVPAEGIVLTKQTMFDCNPLKLKSFTFLKRESDDLDKGIVDIETQESE